MCFPLAKRILKATAAQLVRAQTQYQIQRDMGSNLVDANFFFLLLFTISSLY